MTRRQADLPGYAAHVYPVAAIRVTAGANTGDPIGGIGVCEPGDVYRLDPAAEPLRIMLRAARDAGANQFIAAHSELGAPGDRLGFEALLTLMAPDGERVEIVLVSHAARNFALPLSPMVPNVDYVLLEAGLPPADLRIADIVCVSFAAGTLITLPGGSQRPIEALNAGDMVLTRDNGAQPVRWVGRATLRARGAFAPVVIPAGLMGNGGDLVVSPHHRIFIYQRGRRRVGGTAELLVQAKHLVDGENVVRRTGGFVDYYSLVFDRHEIIYAEGIPAESLMVNDATLSLLPPDMAAEVRARFPGLSQTQHFGTEATRRALDEFGRDALFFSRTRE